MRTIHVVKFALLAQGARVQRGLVTLGGRSVDFWLNNTPKDSRLLITTDTAADNLPKNTIGSNNSVLVRKDAGSRSMRVITIYGRALYPALTQAWTTNPNIADIGTVAIKALDEVLPGYKFV